MKGSCLAWPLLLGFVSTTIFLWRSPPDRLASPYQRFKNTLARELFLGKCEVLNVLLLKSDTRKNFLLVSKATGNSPFLEHLGNSVVNSNNLREPIPPGAEAGTEAMQLSPAG